MSSVLDLLIGPTDKECDWINPDTRDKLDLLWRDLTSKKYHCTTIKSNNTNREWIIFTGNARVLNCANFEAYDIYTFLIHLPSMTLLKYYSGKFVKYKDMITREGYLLCWGNNNTSNEGNIDEGNIISIYQGHKLVKSFYLPCTVLYFNTLESALLFPSNSNSNSSMTTFPTDLTIIILQYLYVNYKPLDISFIAKAHTMLYNASFNLEIDDNANRFIGGLKML